MKRFRTVFTYLVLLLAAGFVFGLGFSAPAPTGAAPQAVVLSIQPAALNVFPGQTFTLTLTIAGAVDVGSYEATLFYNPALLSFQALSHPAPRFLAVNGRSAAAPAGDPISNTLLGRLTTAEYSFAANNPAGAGGSGSLAKIRFQALAPGQVPITFGSQAQYDTFIQDVDGANISFSPQSATITILTPIKLFLPLLRR